MEKEQTPPFTYSTNLTLCQNLSWRYLNTLFKMLKINIIVLSLWWIPPVSTSSTVLYNEFYCLLPYSLKSGGSALERMQTYTTT